MTSAQFQGSKHRYSIATLHLNAASLYDDHGSAATDAIRPPRSLKKADASLPRALRLSIAIGVKWYNEASERYFTVMRFSASFATALGLSTAKIK